MYGNVEDSRINEKRADSIAIHGTSACGRHCVEHFAYILSSNILIDLERNTIVSTWEIWESSIRDVK
jgi:hypothetical protein